MGPFHAALTLASGGDPGIWGVEWGHPGIRWSGVM